MVRRNCASQIIPAVRYQQTTYQNLLLLLLLRIKLFSLIEDTHISTAVQHILKADSSPLLCVV